MLGHYTFPSCVCVQPWTASPPQPSPNPAGFLPPGGLGYGILIWKRLCSQRPGSKKHTHISKQYLQGLCESICLNYIYSYKMNSTKNGYGCKYNNHIIDMLHLLTHRSVILECHVTLKRTTTMCLREGKCH